MNNSIDVFSANEQVIVVPSKKVNATAKEEKPLLFVVWVDCNLGMDLYTDWEMNTPPQPLQSALIESDCLTAEGWPTKVCPEGTTPREDGFFSNPATDCPP